MFDLLKLIADSLSRAIPYMVNARNKKKLVELGVRLFYIYLCLQDCIITADSILQRLERYIDSLDVPQAERPTITAAGIRIHLEKQVSNLMFLTGSLDHFGWAFSLLHANIRIRLSVLLEDKSFELVALADMMGNGRFPITSLDAKTYGELVRYIHSDDSTAGSNLTSREVKRALYQVDCLQDGVEPGDEILIAIKEWLRSGKPYEQVREISEVSDALRQVLLQNFSLADMLLAMEKYLRDRNLFCNQEQRSLPLGSLAPAAYRMPHFEVIRV